MENVTNLKRFFYDYEHESLLYIYGHAGEVQATNNLKVQSLQKLSHWECSIVLLAAACLCPLECTQQQPLMF